jgi:hypothetical protein
MHAPNPSTASWRKSSRSSTNANCLEVAFASPAVTVRDSKNATGPVLAFPHAGWTALLSDMDK